MTLMWSFFSYLNFINKLKNETSYIIISENNKISGVALAGKDFGAWVETNEKFTDKDLAEAVKPLMQLMKFILPDMIGDVVSIKLF